MNKTRNFTLAEVLITLVIIGIIAALTVPLLVNGYQKKQTCIKLKKVYSELCQAVSLAEVEYGSKENWEWGLTGAEFKDKYLYPFVKVSTQKMSEARAENIKYYNVSGQETTQLSSMRDSADIITLASGAQVFVGYVQGSGSQTEEGRTALSRKGFIIDINGYKKPNRFGRDVFSFTITPNGVTSTHYDDPETYTVTRTRDELLNGPSSYGYQCKKGYLGLWCAAVIMADSWEIKDDYPW